MPKQLAILIADDHALVRKTLRRTLETEPDLFVVADVATTDEAIAEARRLLIDEELLREHGVSDFERYRYDPSGKLMTDLFVD